MDSGYSACPLRCNGSGQFFEKTASTAAAYFRHLSVVIAIRDLWTKLQFDLLKEFLQLNLGDAAAESASRARICTLAQAFCSDLDKFASTELTEWKTEFLASLSTLEAAAKKGTDETQKRLADAVSAIKEASATALRAAQEAVVPAFINVKIEGAFDGKVTLLVDDAQVAATHLKSFPIDHVRPGFRKIEARASKNGLELQAAVVREIKPGKPEDVVLTLA